MSAEHSLIHLGGLHIPTTPNTIQHGYYRSKLFTLTVTTNPLLAAASPLFSLLERFMTTNTLPSAHRVYENIDHEWKSFRCRLASHKYIGEFAAIAEYFMSATVDELLGKTYLRIQKEPISFIAFTPPTHDEKGPEQRFFELIHYMKERVNQYLDLLELAYYCLICGFEGEHHVRADGRQTLDNLIQELYELIAEHRVHKPIHLLSSPSQSTSHIPELIPHHGWRLSKFALLGLGLFVSIYVASQYLINTKATALYKEQAQHIIMDQY